MDGCSHKTLSNANKRGAKRFPPPSPDPSQDLREGGNVRGKPIGTNFGLPMTINDPPACTGPRALCKLGGGVCWHGKLKSDPWACPARFPPPEKLGLESAAREVFSLCSVWFVDAPDPRSTHVARFARQRPLCGRRL